MKRLLPALWLFLILDAGFSFFQHLQTPLDGDIAAIVLPSDWYEPVLHDPFGWQMLNSGKAHAAPNRYFAHQAMRGWFNAVPPLFQYLADPVQSVYCACATAKTGIQLLLLWMLAAWSSGTARPGRKRFVAAAVLLAPLFQTAGYNGPMGIIDPSVTYTFFYALPAGLFLLFWLPFREVASGQFPPAMKPASVAALALPLIILVFNGPLIPAVALIICPMALWPFVRYKGRVRGSGRTAALLALTFAMISLYSLYIGTWNTEHPANSLPLAERYGRLAKGLADMFTVKLGLPLLALMLAVNIRLMLRHKALPEVAARLRFLKWVGLFALLYLLLLPLGGYREYRPDIVRRDTFLPVLLCGMFAYASTALCLFGLLSGRAKTGYMAAIGLYCLVFTAADAAHSPKNTCEKSALLAIAAARENVVEIRPACPVLAWTNPPDAQTLELNIRILQHWNILRKDQRYTVAPR